MTVGDRATLAEAADRHAQILAVAVLFIALKFATSAGMQLAGESLRRYLDPLELLFAVAAVLIALPVIVWKVRKLPSEQRHIYFDVDTFAGDAMRRARTVSWATVLFLLIGLEVFSKRLPTLPSEFFLQVVLAVMLGAFGTTFLVLLRAGDPARSEARDG